MIKHRHFSVFLLKGEFSSLDDIEERNILRDRDSLEKVGGTRLPANMSLYLVKAEPRRAWWANYFGIQEDVTQVTESAVAFVLVEPHCFALTLGHGRTKISDKSYHHDFGRVVTLNSVDPEKLTATELLEPSIVSWRTTQAPAASAITWLDIEQDEMILKKLAGKPKGEYEEMFKQVTGFSRLRISTSVQSHEWPEFCRTLAALYKSEEYKTKFPEINSVVPIKDPADTRRLDRRLVRAIETRDDSLQLVAPGILDGPDEISFRFSTKADAPAQPVAEMRGFYQHLDAQEIDLRQDDGTERLKGLKLYLARKDGRVAKRHSIRKCLVFDTVLDGHTYHLSEGEWYRIAPDFIKKLNDDLDRHYKDMGLPEYQGGPEKDYNERVGKTSPTFVCLDRTSISPPGERLVEPCDLYAFTEERPTFVHVKISRSARDLSHLFKQGEVSTVLLKFSGNALDRCRQHIKSRRRKSQDARLPNKRNIARARVVFAIAPKKGGRHASERMTLFPKISLRASFEILRRMGVDAKFCYI